MTRARFGLRRGVGGLGRWCRGLCGAALLCNAADCTPATPAEDPSSAESPAPAPGADAPASAEPPASSLEPATESSDVAATSGSGSAAIELDGDDNLDADIAELSRSTKSPDRKGSELAGRDIVYRVTPQGLVIEVNGIHFRPEAKAFREAAGTYGVRLTLSAQSFDDRQYWLSMPDEGPLSIAGKIEGAAGKRQRFSDERKGDAEEVVRGSDPRKFEQRWPGKGQPKLRAGQTLTLEVGLWGVHADGERERPVRRLFEVKLAAANPPQAVVTPPTLDWGN